MQTATLRALPPITDATTDLELAVLAANGHDAAFEIIMRRHNRLLFRTARSILKNDADAEDALQEAYLRAWRAISSFRAEAQLSTWLVRIVINESLGRQRRRGADVIPLDTTTNTLETSLSDELHDDTNLRPERALLRTETRRMMEARIDMLPEVFRTVFILRAVEDLSVEEVAQLLSIPEATVRSRHFRARGLLREGLSRDIDLTIGELFSFDGQRCDRIVSTVLARMNRIDRSP